MNKIKVIIKKIVLNLISFYQKTLSPDHGMFAYKHPYGFCRFHPTCSSYAHQSIARHGVVKGGFLSVKRILKCNPFHKGGFDPVL